jgi:hypothetical protein
MVIFKWLAILEVSFTSVIPVLSYLLHVEFWKKKKFRKGESIVV